MKSEFTISAIFPTTAQAIYEAWLDSEKHTAMTGGKAEITPKPDDAFSAWDGYINGKNLQLEYPNKIVQSWRTSEFKDEDPDSQIEVTLTNTGNGCELTLRHTNLPAGEADYEIGWKEHYFEPMQKYFSKK